MPRFVVVKCICLQGFESASGSYLWYVSNSCHIYFTPLLILLVLLHFYQRHICNWITGLSTTFTTRIAPNAMASIPPAPCPNGSQAAAALIEAGLGSQVLFPGAAAYNSRQSSYWSNCVKRLQPSCIVLPRTSAEVALAVKALVAAEQQFAVRSGGHTHWPGSNNIGEGGVTMDLSLLNTTTYHSDSETVDVDPGGRWRDVYEELHQYGRAVAGYGTAAGSFLLLESGSYADAKSL